MLLQTRFQYLSVWERNVMFQKHLTESGTNVFCLSLFKITFFWLKIYICRGALGINSWASFFLVYTNDISKHLLSLTWPFADDSSQFYSAAHIADIAGIINLDLQLLTKWDKQWPVTFNPLKTEDVLFNLKKLDFLPQLVFDNIPIICVLP